MHAVGEIIAGEHGGRPVIQQNGQTRIALPMAYVEACVSKVEEDFLWRFFEAWDFSNGNIKLHDSEGTPLGRYADHAATIEPDAYVRMEIQAYRWVKQYGLGPEWATIAEMFLRMMEGRAQTSFIEWGQYLTNSDDEKISLGGAQVSMRTLGLRLKDGYRDFFRWYKYVRDCDAAGREPTAYGALSELERERRVGDQIARFKLARGLTKETIG